MRKFRRPEHTPKEIIINRREEAIREKIDELVAGTLELKSLYSQERNDTPRNQQRP